MRLSVLNISDIIWDKAVMIKDIKFILHLFLPVETFGPEVIRHRQRLAEVVRVACSLAQQVFFAHILQPLISFCLPVLHKASSHIIYCCTLYRPRNVPVIFEILKCCTEEAQFLKLH